MEPSSARRDTAVATAIGAALSVSTWGVVELTPDWTPGAIGLCTALALLTVLLIEKRPNIFAGVAVFVSIPFNYVLFGAEYWLIATVSFLVVYAIALVQNFKSIEVEYDNFAYLGIALRRRLFESKRNDV